MPSPTRGSRRRRFDDELDDPFEHDDHDAPVGLPTSPPSTTSDDLDSDEPSWSTYRDAAHGPQPPPAWLVVANDAVDDDIGVVKTGKEADVSLLRRAHADTHCLLAVKRYRDAEHRMFHRDAGYLEGRRVRRTREMRAMQTRTAFGRELIAGQWAAAEFAVLGRLWVAGAAVPYPVQLLGTELMMEFIGTADGVAAPRLAQLRPGVAEAHDLYAQLREQLLLLADAGYAHGDLSAFNLLVHEGRLVLIDLPQAVDLVGNPQGFAYLRRDCENVCTWFAARGVDADAGDLMDELTRAMPG